MNLETLKDLIAKQDNAQREAAVTVKPAHQKALDAAYLLHSEIIEAGAEDKQRDKLKLIIEAAATKQYQSKVELQQAGLILMQHEASITPLPGVALPAVRTGQYLIARCINGTARYPLDKRVKILAALIIGALNQTETGLIDFPTEWHVIPKLEDLYQWGELLDAESVNALRAENDDLTSELEETYRLCNALKQATPQLSTIEEL